MTLRTARRVVVALDASAPSREAARTAAELARRLGAVEVTGVFVEDVNVVRLGSLPTAREIRLPEGTERAIDLETLETELRAAASRARQALAHEASVERVAWSFEVRRGPVMNVVLAATGETDLLVLAEGSALFTGDLLERLLGAARSLVLVAGSRGRRR